MTDMKVNRRQFMKLVGIGTLGPPGAAMTGNSAAARRRKPNVIVIMTDDQGYGDMSCHGNPFVKTPQRDRLWAESVRLTDFHVDPTCSLTRAALMTGRYSSRTGVWLTYAGRHHLRRDEVTMADVLGSNGYRTAIFGTEYSRRRGQVLPLLSGAHAMAYSTNVCHLGRRTSRI